MLDIKLIRQNPDLVKQAVLNKRSDVNIDELLTLDQEQRSLLTSIEQLKKRKNEIAQLVSKDHGNQAGIEEGKKIKLELDEIEARFKKTHEDFETLLLKVPNLPSEDTPVGVDESENVVLRTVGEKPVFDFKPKEHWQLGAELDLIDSERASKVSGSRFAYLKGELAILEFALIQYGLSVLTNRTILEKIIADAGLSLPATPFIPAVVPVFIKPDVFQRMARLEPKDERYHIPSDDLYLIGSAEHTLGSMHMDETLVEDKLPLRYAGFSTSFRREAGSYGKDTKGILRLHQFDKLEMEVLSTPETSLQEQDFLVAIQEYLMTSLGLPYRVIITCTGDMGDPDARHIDLEAWMPGQDQYRETHSADLMTDYQSRRLNIKVKREDGSQFVHMNDATAFAVGRTIIAIMENYQTKDGTIRIPDALLNYMLGIKEIGK